MKFLSLIILLASQLALADQFKVIAGNESISFRSKDIVNRGTVEMDAAFNPNITLQYNRVINSDSRLFINYKISQLNVFESIGQTSIINELNAGQYFLVENLNIQYSLGLVDRLIPYSDNSDIKLTKLTLPIITLGANNSFYNLNSYLLGVGFKVSHVNSLNKKVNGFKVENGAIGQIGLNVSKKYKNFYYKASFDIIQDYQKTEVTHNRYLKNSLSLDLVWKLK